MPRSERAYGILLLAYPREFRNRYGGEMVQVFGDSCWEAAGWGNGAGDGLGAHSA